MDLSTMRKKLDNHEYSNAQAFFADFKLMIRNCFQFNPAGTPVNLAGIELQRLFDDKWKNLPQPQPHPAYDDDMDAEGDESEDDNHHRTFPILLYFPFLTEALLLGIAEMEKQIEAMREGAEDYEYLRLLRDRVVALERAGARTNAVISARRLLDTAADRVTVGVGASAIWWAEPKDRSVADDVRLEILEALVRLQTR